MRLVASARATLTDRSVRSGRNSCSGGSISRIVTGSPSIAVEDLDEVAALQRQQRVQRGLPARVVLGQDEPLDELAALAEEHVLGAAQADAPRAEPAGPRAVLAGVGVGAHPQAAPLRRRAS